MERTMKTHVTKMHKKKIEVSQKSKEKLEEPVTDPDTTRHECDGALYKCDKCKYKTVHETKIKKHKRVSHGMTSSFTSPARK